MAAMLACMASITASAPCSPSIRNTASTTLPVSVGTRRAVPLSLPSRCGSTLPTALAAPVEAGMMLFRVARFLLPPNASTTFWVAVAACVVLIRPAAIGKERSTTAASGARQLVVQLALETIVSSPVSDSWLTPTTTVGGVVVAGRGDDHAPRAGAQVGGAALLGEVEAPCTRTRRPRRDPPTARRRRPSRRRWRRRGRRSGCCSRTRARPAPGNARRRSRAAGWRRCRPPPPGRCRRRSRTGRAAAPGSRASRSCRCAPCR